MLLNVPAPGTDDAVHPALETLSHGTNDVSGDAALFFNNSRLKPFYGSASSACNFALQNPPDRIIQWVEIWGVRGPFGRGDEIRLASPEPLLGLQCLVGWGGVLLECKGRAPEVLLGPGFEGRL